MSNKMIDHALAVRTHLSPSARLTLFVLANRADDDGDAWPLLETLTQETGLSRRSVQYAVGELTEAGIVVCSDGRGRGRGKVFRLTFGTKGADVAPIEAKKGAARARYRDEKGADVAPIDRIKGANDDTKRRKSQQIKGANDDTEGGAIGGDDPKVKTQRETKEGTRREIQPPSPLRVPDYSPAFLAFYEAYPKHENKKAAFELWEKLAPDQALIATIMSAIERQKRGRKWIDGYANAPDVWLRGAKWEDEPEPVRGPPTNGARPANAATTVKGWAERNGHGAVRDNDAGVAGVLPATIRR
jgi:DNA-binding transcriptional ArsR family regulator